ncbi:YisB protein [Xylariaceae sp. FL0016]|nr:YisB protein [Xylariaceae sp. FL0016]
MLIPNDEVKNYELLRECLSTVLVDRLSWPEPKPKPRRKHKANRKGAALQNGASEPEAHQSQTRPRTYPNPDPQSDLGMKTNNGAIGEGDGDSKPDLNDTDDLVEFADYIAAGTFAALPEELRTLDYYTYVKNIDLQARYALPLTGADIPQILPTLEPSIADSLSVYGITDDSVQGIDEFLAPILTTFLTTLATPPPPPSSTKDQASGCEICGRDWIPLSYHHLIPRFVHAKAVKRGWHREEDLQNVAWLCGACHRFVHRFAGHEELARNFYTVELLMAEEAVTRWAEWVARLRWKAR